MTIQINTMGHLKNLCDYETYLCEKNAEEQEQKYCSTCELEIEVIWGENDSICRKCQDHSN